MRNGEYLTSNANVAWPFDPDVPNLPPEVARAFADGGATLKTEELGDEVSISNIWLIKDGVKITGLGFTVLRNRQGTRFEVMLSDSEFTSIAKDRYFFVLDNRHVRELSRDYTGNHDKYKLDPGAISTVADKVTSISIYNRKEDGSIDIGHPDATALGDVAITPGYNIDLLTAEEAKNDLSASGAQTALYLSGLETLGQTVTGIALVALPGAGAGTVPCPEQPKCEERYQGNVSAASDGTLVIEGDGCYNVSLAYSNIYGGTVISIGGRCTACCQCENYVETGNRLGEQGTRVQEIKDRLKADAAAYNNAARKYR
jgi:hypothetical protein